VGARQDLEPRHDVVECAHVRRLLLPDPDDLPGRRVGASTLARPSFRNGLSSSPFTAGEPGSRAGRKAGRGAGKSPVRDREAR
jgi:hypothetical protein